MRCEGYSLFKGEEGGFIKKGQEEMQHQAEWYRLWSHPWKRQKCLLPTQGVFQRISALRAESQVFYWAPVSSYVPQVLNAHPC